MPQKLEVKEDDLDGGNADQYTDPEQARFLQRQQELIHLQLQSEQRMVYTKGFRTSIWIV